MPNYTYRCTLCGSEYLKYLTFDDSDLPVVCPECPDSTRMSKVLGVNYRRSMADGYSPSTGGYVSSEHDLREKLKAASDAATLRTGIPHDFTPIDMRDRSQTGQTDEGLDATMRRQVNTGQREAKKWL